jgi:hypothetical protein
MSASGDSALPGRASGHAEFVLIATELQPAAAGLTQGLPTGAHTPLAKIVTHKFLITCKVMVPTCECLTLIINYFY